MFAILKPSLNTFWEYSPSSANLASGGLVENKERSPVGEEERKRKMDDGVDTSLASEGTDLFVDLWEGQLCLWDPECYSS